MNGATVLRELQPIIAFSSCLEHLQTYSCFKPVHVSFNCKELFPQLETVQTRSPQLPIKCNIVSFTLTETPNTEWKYEWVFRRLFLRMLTYGQS